MGINRGTVLDLINDVHTAGGFKDYNNYSYLFNQVDTMPESKEDAEPHWIPVTERLPDKENKSYWICTNTGYQCQCRWTNNIYGFGSIGDRWGWKIVDIPQYTYVVAWMPLPEPYKGMTEWTKSR